MSTNPINPDALREYVEFKHDIEALGHEEHVFLAACAYQWGLVDKAACAFEGLANRNTEHPTEVGVGHQTTGKDPQPGALLHTVDGDKPAPDPIRVRLPAAPESLRTNDEWIGWNRCLVACADAVRAAGGEVIEGWVRT